MRMILYTLASPRKSPRNFPTKINANIHAVLPSTIPSNECDKSSNDGVTLPRSLCQCTTTPLALQRARSPVLCPHVRPRQDKSCSMIRLCISCPPYKPSPKSLWRDSPHGAVRRVSEMLKITTSPQVYKVVCRSNNVCWCSGALADAL
jgi:hypothetical protein